MSGPSKNPKPRAALLEIPAELHQTYLTKLAENSRVLDDGSGCIVWTFLDPKGYGRIAVTIEGIRHTTTAHRVAWFLKHGRIDDPDLVLDHLCRNRACLNVDHLELVTITENSARGNSWQKKADRPVVTTERTSCKNGHPFPQNAAMKPGRNGQLYLVCLECSRESGRRWYHRQRELTPEEGLSTA
jgi:hypothetical protein